MKCSKINNIHTQVRISGCIARNRKGVSRGQNKGKCRDFRLETIDKKEQKMKKLKGKY